MTERLTKRQKQVYLEIKRFVREERMIPTVRELAQRLKVTPSTAHKLLRALKSKGYIELKDNSSRGIILGRPSTGTVAVPVLGRIPAGEPVISEEYLDGYIELDSTLVTGGELFALTVSGDSMIGANILDGDTAIIRSQENAESGEIVAALIDGEATLKRLVLRDREYILRPENDAYEPISLDARSEPVKIIGKLIAVVRKY